MRIKRLFKNKIINNATWIIACKIGQSVFSIIISMLSARLLGPSNYGLLSYATSITSFALPIAQLGLGNTIVHELISEPEAEGKTMGTAIISSLIASLLSITGIITFVLIANPGETITLYVTALYSISLLFQATELIQYWYQAKYLAKYSSIVSLIAYVFVSAYKLFLLFSGKSIYWFAIANALDYMLISFLLLYLYKRLNGSKLSVNFHRFAEMFQRSKHYIFVGLMVTIFVHTDSVMLKIMTDDAVTGLYSAAVSCAGITSFIFSAVISASTPEILESKRKSNIFEFENGVSALYCIIIYLSLAQSVFMFLFAKPIIQMLYGDSFLEAANILKFSVWYTTFSYIGGVRGIWILAENKQKYLLVMNLTGALSNVILNYALIPLLGAYGAAIASIISQCVTNVLMGYIIPSIRRNNYLMIKGLNPRTLIEYLKIYL